MKLHTDVTTLSRLFPLFKEAGLQGLLTGNFDEIKDLTLPMLAAQLLDGGNIPLICSIITKSDYYTPSQQLNPEVLDPQKSKPWDECSLDECLGVIIPFFIDITVGPIELAKAVNQINPNLNQTKTQTSS